LWFESASLLGGIIGRPNSRSTFPTDNPAVKRILLIGMDSFCVEALDKADWEC
jgi:hypothetical protein